MRRSIAGAVRARTDADWACQWEGEYLICEMQVTKGPVEPVRGLFCIRRDAFGLLPDDRGERIAVLKRKFGRYICRLRRPRSAFVFELRRLWPFRRTVNWPF
jgi:hypothetical protein